jgi:hypothetical protein
MGVLDAEEEERHTEGNVAPMSQFPRPRPSFGSRGTLQPLEVLTEASL